MFPYWSAPPSLLRIWACPEDPAPMIDSRFRLGSPAVRAAEDSDSHLGRVGSYVRALFPARAVAPRLAAR